MNESKALTKTIFILELILRGTNKLSNFLGGIFTYIISFEDEEVEENWFQNDEDNFLLKHEEEHSIKTVLKYLGEILLEVFLISFLTCLIIISILFFILFKPVYSYISKVLSYSFNIISVITAIGVIILSVKYLNGGEKVFLESIEFIKTTGILEFIILEVRNIINILFFK